MVVGNMVCRKNGQIGNCVYAYVLVGNMVIGNVAIENSVAGKKSRHD